jgi:hypothetical protein
MKKSTARRHTTRGGREQKRQPARDSFWSLAIPIAVGVVVVAIIVGAIYMNEQRTAASSAAAVPTATLSVPVVTTAPQPTTEVPFPNIKRISLKDTQAKLGKGEAILIDVRSKESYDQAHAVGALSIPEEEIKSRLSELPKDKLLILYCT